MGPSYSTLHPERLDIAKENGHFAEKRGEEIHNDVDRNESSHATPWRLRIPARRQRNCAAMTGGVRSPALVERGASIER